MRFPLETQVPELARHIRALRAEEERTTNADVKTAIAEVLYAFYYRVAISRTLEWLREHGWSVAVHNDYRQDGKSMTFWLFTHPGGRWAKGEGATDEEALDAVVEMVMHGVKDEP